MWKASIRSFSLRIPRRERVHKSEDVDARCIYSMLLVQYIKLELRVECSGVCRIAGLFGWEIVLHVLIS